MRVFLFKIINKQRWTLYIEKSEFFSKKFELTPTTTTASTSKTNLILNKLKNIAIESKNEIENAQSGVGLKGKLKAMLDYMESKIHPEEAILQQFSKLNNKNVIKQGHHNHSDQHHHHELRHHEKNRTQIQLDHFNDHRDKPSFQIYYPSNIGYRRAQRFSQVLMKQKIQYHKKWLTINSLLIPVTFAATILPGPNVFLAYNLYRCYGHYQALRGCNNLLTFSKDHGRVLFKPSLEMFECLNQEQQQQQQQHEQEIQKITNTENIIPTATTTTTTTNNNNNIQNNNYETLSERLRIPGLFEYVKRIESLETK
ncbi:hypothetical protein DICPUDRAFT_87736 [Dictyostelium purpureum]|uniref:Uncharacterized protein n=1 Tax=Dictyostelium purpureum TaxID=5786 RepID=F0ZK15_DICPU|nr:uncharacterized protein DICPUDRAFT_87736 [Dictyostelium purpureum]EGC35710.1 hypothetical protein DICPUDRAFT_87736 [Dictyostelium purpureum]|eukprot:XP_003287766.1 hypothetical protein DICPUDRAFT_87736 [Dictyostelium purpureum]